ncbi:MAG: hypothetical protein AB1546_14635 [bacterium]
MIKNGTAFGFGVFLALIFFGLLVLIFSPVIKGRNGLQFADDSFNRLAKGSSYFVPKVSESAEKFIGKKLNLTVKFDEKDKKDRTVDLNAVSRVFTMAGAQVEVGKDTGKVIIKGDLGKILMSAVSDSDSMYKNNGEAVSARYGVDEKTVMRAWWGVLNKADKQLKKDRLLSESKIVGEINRKAVEPAYNFYGIEAQRVSEHAGLLTMLLVFYIFYTLLWGYAIYLLFNGLGLTMKKAKVKTEV